MDTLFDSSARKRAANLSVNGDLLDRARALGINLSATLEGALAQALREARRTEWAAANRESLEAYNEHVARRGVFSDGLRGF